MIPFHPGVRYVRSETQRDVAPHLRPFIQLEDRATDLADVVLVDFEEEEPRRVVGKRQLSTGTLILHIKRTIGVSTLVRL